MEPKRHRKVAIIGAGPAGLTAATDLVRQGYDVTVFERQEKPGGMLAYGIPHYRLPASVLRREIQSILDLGVDLRTSVTFGQDITIESLEQDGYEAILLAIGCHQGIPLETPGADAEGVLDAVAFLRQVAGNGKGTVGKRVAVVGGGDTAVDSARSALRLGAEEVHLVYRRTRDEMPAHPEEISEAEHEGVRFHFLAAPREVVTGKGRVVGLVCDAMSLGEFDEGGRRRPVKAEEAAEIRLDVDTVIAAIGQRLRLDGAELETARGKIAVDTVTMATSRPNVFAGGDATVGPMTAVDAIADGHRCAQAIHSYLTGEPVPAPRIVPKTTVTADVLAALEETADEERPAVVAEKIADADRVGSFQEVELGCSPAAACQEAKRCLHCDYIVVENEA